MMKRLLHLPTSGRSTVQFANGWQPHSPAPIPLPIRVATGLFFLLLSAILPTVSAHPESIAWNEAGVSRDLAEQRAAALSSLTAELTFRIPAERTNAITGTVRYRGKRFSDDHPLLLDFTEPSNHVHAVRLGDEDVPFSVSNEHIRVGVPPRALGNKLDVAVDFTAGELSLNRRDDFLFTLFVPDRARTVFPCFDQPDLKVKYTLAVETPVDWTVASAGLDLKVDGPDPDSSATRPPSTPPPSDRRWWRFGETQPLATYQFAFAAGKFEIVERDGMRLYHREPDPEKRARNLDAIFDLHRQSRDWMEAYTGVPYPYQTFDFVAIPGFPYAGMEHPGNIAYRDRFLFLPENPSEDERLRRAHLITHEVAHAWFGDLVTMTWFDDVWLKEVFANFMADKMVEPMFPDVDHRLQFFLGHVPRAAAIDRSEGAHPVLQNLPNLRDAGTIYGALIYHKAPIMMRELERQLGPDNLKRGLKTYLDRFEHGNATWDDLIACLTPEAPPGFDLPAWSHAWVREAGLPVVRMEGPKASIVSGPTQRLKTVRIDTLVAAATAAQTNGLPAYKYTYNFATGLRPVEESDQPESKKAPPAGVWLPDTDGVYARVERPDAEREWLSAYQVLPDPIQRGIVIQELWEIFLHGDVDAIHVQEVLLASFVFESNEQLRERLLSLLSTLKWRFLNPTERASATEADEVILLHAMKQIDSPGTRRSLFKSLVSLYESPETHAYLTDIWLGRKTLEGVTLDDRDNVDLAFALALRANPHEARQTLNTQRKRLAEGDAKRRFDFIAPALDPDPAVRRKRFEDFKTPANRRPEPWVRSALSWLHHPLRQEGPDPTHTWIREALDELEEVKATGDIFFPQGWVAGNLSGHRSPEAAAAVRGFLDERDDLPGHLRLKALQAADLLFRAANQQAPP